MTKSDPSFFKNPDDFKWAYAEIAIPNLPKDPKNIVERKNFDSDLDYHKHMVKAYNQYELDLKVYEEEKQSVSKIQSDILDLFKKFCIEDNMDDEIPESVKQKAYDMAHNKKGNTGFQEIYDELKHLSEIVNFTFKKCTSPDDSEFQKNV